jgi:hypothetical protein
MLERAPFDLVSYVLLGSSALQWYGDGAPTWKQGKKKKAAKTSRQAEMQRRKLIKVLRRHGKGIKSALQLADLLESCREDRRCLSAACPECSRAFQRWFVSVADSVVWAKGDWWVVSVVWRDHRFEEGKLAADLLFQPLRHQLHFALTAAGIRQGIGGFDISMNEHVNSKFAPHWRPHAWVFVATKDPKGLKVCLKKEFPASKQVRRPVQVVPFDYSLTGLAYAMKTDFSRRVSLPRKNGLLMIRRNTRNRPLRSMQKVELALALHRAGLVDRVFQLGGISILDADNA